MGILRIETKDRRLIVIDANLLQRSKVIQDMCEYCKIDIDNDNGNSTLPMHGINHEVLLKILLWLEFHKSDEEPQWVQFKEEPDGIELQIDDWDKEFLREKLPIVQLIMLGADYLDIPWLVKLCAHKLRIRGRCCCYGYDCTN